MSATNLATATRPFFTALTISAALTATADGADPPRVGTVRELPVISINLTAGSMDKESKRVIYAPPPGWYVRSHRVVTSQRYGTVTYAVSTVPAGWNWTADERTSASGRASGTAHVAIPHGWQVGGTLAGSQDASSNEHQTNTSSHHVLVVDVTVKGNGLWQGGGGVEMTVFAEMVYVGTRAVAGR